VHFLAGDMTDPALGRFDHVVAMDSLIHYEPDDVARVLGAWAPRCSGQLLFTVAPSTPALAAMHAVGRFFPRGDRAPAIVPQRIPQLQQRLAREPALAGFAPGGCTRIARGFYTSQALQWQRRA
jgi:magnesium-protoporphyrin O-methyltransferase